MLFYNLIEHLVSFNSRSDIALQHLESNNKININSPCIGIIFKVGHTHCVQVKLQTNFYTPSRYIR